MELYIENYKNIKDKKFEIVNNRLILVGKNSVGKTNVLEAVELGEYSLYGKDNEYCDVLYIPAEIDLDNEIRNAETSDFISLFNTVYSEDITCIDDMHCQIMEKLNIDVTESRDINLNLGAGFKRRLVYQMFRLLAMKNDGRKYIILIDSPELHAHPSMVRKFCNELRSLADSGHLVIITTHSEVVVQYFYNDVREIAKISIEEELKVNQIDLQEYTAKLKQFYNVKNIYRLPNGKPNESLSYIIKTELESFCKTILQNKTFKILFADYIVVGEGASEDILFDYILTEEDNPFLEYNVDYITAFGKFYLPFFFILANMYDVGVVCVYDVDNLDNKSHLAFHQAFQNYEKECRDRFYCITMDPDLETELNIEMANHRVEKPLTIYNALYKSSTNIDFFKKRLEKALQIIR